MEVKPTRIIKGAVSNANFRAFEAALFSMQ